MIVLTIIALATLGLILGSFANALVWRLYGQEELQQAIAGLEAQKASKRRDKLLTAKRQELQALSISRGRSMCSNCRHALAAKDLVPLFSWLWLRGCCRYCRQPIADPPLMEAGLALAFVASYVFWPLDWSGYGLLAFGFWLAFLTGFAALTLYDMRWYLLPDRIVWPLVGLAGLQVLLQATVFGAGWEALVTAAWGVLTTSGVFWFLYIVSKGEWIGFGDVKLALALGALVGGPMQGLLLIFIASLLGTLASLPLLVKGGVGRGSVIPFGPFLMAAAVILVLFGQRLTDWLASYFLLPL